MEAYKVILILCCIPHLVLGNIQCQDENNNPVDWYVIYKLPKIKFSSDPIITAGKKYMYITSSTLDKGWQISPRPIDDTQTLLTHTLSFIDNTTQKVLWLIYNDQGNETCFNCGHTKGVVAGDRTGGIWLTHSIPHLQSVVYPKTGLKYGQSALCITLTQNMLDSVGDLLAYNTAHFIKWNINDELKDLYPKIIAAFNHVEVKEPWSLKSSLTSVKGTQFSAFAKAKPFNKDLYEWVASSLQTDLLTETWINDMVLPSSCSLQYKVMNVESIVIPELKTGFTSHKDHSKFAISKEESKPWICIGDINRAKSQEARGGGTACFNNKALWESYTSLINTTENCSTHEVPAVFLMQDNKLKEEY